MGIFNSGQNSTNLNAKMLGLPFHFTNLTDPNGRVYNKYLQNALTVGLIPGRPQFNPATLRKAKFDALNSLMKEDSDSQSGEKEGWSKKIDVEGYPFKGGGSHDYEKHNFYGSDASDALDKEWQKLNENEKKGHESLEEKDLRFYGFKADVSGYRKVLNLLLNEVGGKMIGIGLHNIEGYYKSVFGTSHSQGIIFCAEGASTVSESFSSELSETTISGMTKGLSSKAREVSYYLGMSDNVSDDAAKAEIQKRMDEGGGQGGGSAGQGLGDYLKNAVSGALNAADAIVKGENLLFPKIWNNTSFEKSINLSFKFLSPYGDVENIFKHVYIPFLALLAFAGPVQTSVDGYKSPFLCRVNCPGIMESNMCMITNLSWTRGTSSNLYSAAGLPLGIDVTATFTDLYPTMSLASSLALLRQNIGLSSFLDNMCNLSNMQANIAANIAASISSKVSAIYGIADSATIKIKDFIDNQLFDAFRK